MVGSPIYRCTQCSSSSSSLIKIPRYSTSGQSAFTYPAGISTSCFVPTGTSAKKYQGDTPSQFSQNSYIPYMVPRLSLPTIRSSPAFSCKRNASLWYCPSPSLIRSRSAFRQISSPDPRVPTRMRTADPGFPAGVPCFPFPDSATPSSS